MSARFASVTARAHGKINPYLEVGDLMEDGYHDLVTVFQSLAVAETVTLTVPPDGSEYTVDITGPYADEDIPRDASNLALAAVLRLSEATGVHVPVAVTIDKHVPVAGGMGGGSADAAAALLAYSHLIGGVDEDLLAEVASALGADVPFALHGGTMLGTGHGDDLTPVLTRGTYHWVLATSTGMLSTPAVYRKLDELRAARSEGFDPAVGGTSEEDGTSEAPRASAAEPADAAPVLAALAHGDPAALAEAVHNDMTDAAVALLPDVAHVMGTGIRAGALRALVSGSGPTVGFLVADDRHALDIAVLLSASRGVRHVVRTHGPASGAEILAARPWEPSGD